MTRTSRTRRPRRGWSPTGLLLLLSLLGAVAATAAVIGPRFGHGEARAAVPPLPQPARREDHRTLMEHFSGLIGRSTAILAVHQRGVTPYLEMVLWLSDDNGSGHAEPSEVAIVSHSRLMQTVTLYRWTAGAAKPDGGLAVVGPSAPAFCDAWRANWN